MADQNLLNDDDFFAKALESLDDKPKDKKEKVYSEEDNLFKPQNLDEQSAEELAYIESSLQERGDSQASLGDQGFSPIIEDKKSEEQAQKKTTGAGIKQPSESSQGDYNYKQVYFDMDEEQEKVSYKPFFITFLIIIIVGGGLYFGWKLFLKDSNLLSKIPFFKSGQTVEQSSVTQEPGQIEQPEQIPVHTEPQLSPQEKQRNDYLSNLAGRTNQNVGLISDVISLSSKATKLSSMVVYDSDFILEVFGKSQQDIARLNNEFRSSSSIKNLKLVSSTQRSGTNSGVLGVFSGSFATTGSTAKSVTLNLTGNNEAGNWIKDILSKNGLKVTTLKNRSTKNQDAFKVYEIEVIAKGSVNSCLNVLKTFITTGTNVILYKFNCGAIDQTNFTTSNYQLKLVLRIYA